MMRGYKKSYLVINILLSITLLVLVSNFYIMKNTSYLFSNVVILTIFIILFFVYGYEKKNRRFTYETMFYTFSVTIIYLIISYIIGIKTGFSANIYKLNNANLIKNIIPYTFTILIGELLRYEIIIKGEKSTLAYTLITIILIVVDCTLYLTTFDLSTGDGQIKFICYILLPSISKNCFLLYTTKIAGPYPNFIYRILMDLKNFILPIFPNFGMMIESILLTAIPAVIGIIICCSLKQYQNKEIEGKSLRYSKIYIYASAIIITFIVITIVLLTSCKFKYGMLSIGSGSMTGTINKGDAVIYEAVSKNCIPKVKDVLVFRKEGKIIVHRIIKKVKVSKDETVYYTKGDANKSEDGYPIPEDDLIGIVKMRVKYIGIPSVAIGEFTNKK